MLFLYLEYIDVDWCTSECVIYNSFVYFGKNNITFFITGFIVIRAAMNYVLSFYTIIWLKYIESSN